MKKFFTLLIALCLSVGAWAYDFKVDGIYYNITSDVEPYTVEVTWGGEDPLEGTADYVGHINIPESITSNGTTYSVASIGQLAFQSCKGVTSITIPNSVTTIHNQAFSGCDYLSSIVIPNSVHTIGSSVFYDCHNLSTITIPSSVTNIAYNTFSGINNSTILDIDAANTNFSYANDIIYNKDKSAIISFLGINDDKNAIIPNTVKTIEYRAFAYSNLASVSIPSSVTNIGEGAFQQCESLTAITIPNSVTHIENSAFSGCIGLNYIIIPSSVTNIGEYAFSSCTNLRNVIFESTTPPTFGNYVVGIYNGDATIITVPSNSKEAYQSSTDWWQNCIFKYADETVVGDFFTQENNDGIELQYKITSFSPQTVEVVANYNSYGGDVIIPSNVNFGGVDYNVTSIGRAAFSRCENLTSVVIPNSVTSLGQGIFAWSENLSAVEISNSVESLGNSVFTNCKSLTTITLPNSITSIGSNTFEGCVGLTTVNTSSSLTSIGTQAFRNCTSLASLTIPKSVTSIEQRAFNGCQKLTEVIVENPNPPTLGSYAFDQFITTISIPFGSLNDYSNSTAWNIYKIREFGKTYIDYEFSVANSQDIDIHYKVTSINPMSVELIAGGAINGVINIPADVTFEGNTYKVTSIGDNAFEYLTEAIIESPVPPSLGYNVFPNDSWNKVIITVPKDTKELYSANSDWNVYQIREVGEPYLGMGFNALNSDGINIYYKVSSTEPLNVEITTEENYIVENGNNAYIGSVTIPATVSHDNKTYTVTAIGANAFAGCDELTTISVPNSIENINSSAFYGCDKLTNIIINSSNENFSFENGILYNKDKTSLISYLPSNTNAEFTIPNSVIRIEDYALYYTDLHTLTIHAGVLYIGNYALGGINNLISLGETPAQLGEYVFGNISSDNTVINTVIDENAKEQYNRTPQWKEITTRLADEIVMGLNFTVNNIIYEISNLEPLQAKIVGNTAASGVINLPASVEYATKQIAVNEIYYGAFEYNTTITEMYIPATITIIEFDESTFPTYPKDFGDIYTYTQNFKAINVHPDNPVYKSIDGVLYNHACDSLLLCPAGKEGKITIANTTKVIYYAAFAYCFHITEVELPNALTSIEDDAFYATIHLETINIPAATADINDEFRMCLNLTAINVADGNKWFSSADGILYNKSQTDLIRCPEGKSGTISSIPNTVNTISYAAFENCSKVENIEIPKSVVIVSESAFKGTAWYNIQPEGLVYVGDILYDYKGNIPTNYHLNIKNGTRAIADNFEISFYSENNPKNITNITAPNTLVYIGNTGLEDTQWYAEQPDGVVYIGSVAYRYKGYLWEDAYINFSPYTKGIAEGFLYDFNHDGRPNTDALTSVSIPNTVSYIGANAFYGCRNLRNITCQASTPPTLIGDIFNGVPIEEASLTVPQGSISLYKAADQWKLFLVSFKVGQIFTTKIDGQDLSFRIISLNPFSVELINNTTKNSSSTYSGEINIPSRVNFDGSDFTVTSIAANAFSNSTITEVIIPSTIETIGDAAFSNCTKLTKITTTASILPTMGTDVFSGITASKVELVVPNGTKEIYNNAAQWDIFASKTTEDTPTNIEQLQATQPFTQQGNKLVFAQDTNIAVYSLSGVCVYKGTTQSYTLPQKGMFIVVSNGKAFKVISR